MKKLYNKEAELIPGQNLRYLGKGFPGYVNGQPYMVLISHHNASQYLVEYNELKIVVNRRYVKAVW